MSTPQHSGAPDETQANRPAEAGNGGGDETAASRFRQQVAAKKASFDENDSEQELWAGGYSSKAMLGTWLVMLLASIGILVAPMFVEPFTYAIAGGIVLAMWVIGILVFVYRRICIHYQLTTQRFILQTGILTRRTDRTEVIDIDDVSYTQGPVQRALGIGTIKVTSSDRSHPELVMVGIDDVKRVASLIDDIRRKERRKRALHIESV